MTESTAMGAGPWYRRSAVRRRFAQIVLSTVVFLVILLVSAGTVAWWNAWAYLAECCALALANLWYLVPRNVEIIEERGRLHRGTRTFDRVILTCYTLAYLGLLTVAGLDERCAWFGLGWPWALLGGILLAVGMIPIVGAMAVNRNLEPTVRIQTDRGHQVATAGPYRWVRHPMYAGTLVQLPATALLLGSVWAMVPAAICAVVLVIRTVLEDGMLRRELPGYVEYARATRHRLVPGVW